MDPTIADMYYLQLPTGGPTQADIWSNLPSGSGIDQLCNGLVITPRCDFAHSKSPVINYLPIVSLEEYFLSVACFPHLERSLAETRDGLRTKLATMNLDALFELGLPIDELFNEVRQSCSTPKLPRSRQTERAEAEFEAAYERIKQLTALLDSPRLTWDQLKYALNQKRLLSIQRDLIKNNNTDTYFLPPCGELIEVPSLVLLRHIYTCPISLVERTKRYVRANPAPEKLLRLKSPFIESLMSKFAALFTRVGTRDIPDHAVQAFILSDGKAPR